ncbi:MAG: Rpn family recombination-promoting nuclease/putative transposase [Prevotellaceae bacterium]|jgi:predicted transposase/invertase (TIGR01784 family)|nr:Rpn family recombination-promoting nuclease/putative transposase [Prevotellaceae bacterium]
MAKYLDPKNDLVFKRIFGGHPKLLISFLNALMPLEEGRKIVSLEYLSPEMVPENPLRKFSIVDVRCKDNYGRQFIVEMQMEWSSAFPNRMLYNASKVYSDQLQRKALYGTLQPVYGLGILNEVFDRKTGEFYHRYQMSNRQNTNEVINGIELVLVELPKFKPDRWVDRRMAVLWLRFLREVYDSCTQVPQDLQEDEAVGSAVTMCEVGAYTEEELAVYERYWDYVLKEKMFLDASFAEGEAKGEAKGKAEGRAEGEREYVLKLHQKGKSATDIAELTDLPVEKVESILKSS